MSAQVLFTRDEARQHVARSALACITRARANGADLVALVRGEDVPGSMSLADRQLAADHGAALAEVRASGHGWVIAEELEGIVSATGIARGRADNLDLLAAQLQD
jgi:hypothetical protein